MLKLIFYLIFLRLPGAFYVKIMRFAKIMDFVHVQIHS